MCRYNKTPTITSTHYCPSCRKKVISLVSESGIRVGRELSKFISVEQLTCNSAQCLEWYERKCKAIKSSNIVDMLYMSGASYAFQARDISLYREELSKLELGDKRK